MKPIYDREGDFTGTIQDGNTSFPAIPENRHGRKFLASLKGTLEEWLAESPYVAPVKSEDDLPREKEAADIKALDPESVTDPVVKLLLKREQRRIK